MLEVASILYPYLVVLYLADSLLYVGKQQVAFSSTLNGRFRKLNAGIHLGGLLPGDRLFITGQRPLGLTASGFYQLLTDGDKTDNQHRPENYAFCAFAGIESLSTDGNTLNLNEGTSIQTSSPQAAALWAERLSTLGALTYAERTPAIEAGIHRDTDLNAVRNAYNRWSLTADPINLMSALMFACFFMLLPMGLYLVPVAAGLMVGLILCMLVVYGLLFLAACRQHKHLYPKDTGGLYKLSPPCSFLRYPSCTYPST